jgi:hypothetical protein
VIGLIQEDWTIREWHGQDRFGRVKVINSMKAERVLMYFRPIFGYKDGRLGQGSPHNSLPM